jgi:hypothetical protein
MKLNKRESVSLNKVSAGVRLAYCVSLSNGIKRLGSTGRKRVAGVEAGSAGLVLRVGVVGVGIVRPVGPSSIGVSAGIYTLASGIGLKHFAFAQALVRAAFCVRVISSR